MAHAVAAKAGFGGHFYGETQEAASKARLEENPMVTLKDGTIIPLGANMRLLPVIKELFERNRDEFYELLALSQDLDYKLSDKAIEVLSLKELIDPLSGEEEGEIIPGKYCISDYVAEILRNAYTTSGDRPRIISPLHIPKPKFA